MWREKGGRSAGSSVGESVPFHRIDQMPGRWIGCSQPPTDPSWFVAKLLVAEPDEMTPHPTTPLKTRPARAWTRGHTPPFIRRFRLVCAHTTPRAPRQAFAASLWAPELAIDSVSYHWQAPHIIGDSIRFDRGIDHPLTSSTHNQPTHTTGRGARGHSSPRATRGSLQPPPHPLHNA